MIHRTNIGSEYEGMTHQNGRPTVSIVIPVGGTLRFLNILASVLAQTFRDFELILVCEEEQRLEIERYLLSNETLGVCWHIVETPMRGLTFAPNLGIMKASGEFIARWDSDDLFDATRLARQVEAFRSNPRLAVLGTRTILIDEYEEHISFHRFKLYKEDKSIRRALQNRQPIPLSSLMMPRALLLASGGYRFGFASEDHAMFLRLARDESLEFRNLADVCCYYRPHDNQLSGRQRQFDQFCDIAGFMIIEFLHTLNPMFLAGALATHPLARDFRQAMRVMIRNSAHALRRTKQLQP